MPIEIERKFLVQSNDWKKYITSKQSIIQAYMNNQKNGNVRVRTKGDKAYITIKGKSEGLKRLEFEYEIPFDDAIQIIEMSEYSIIQKTRYEIKLDGLVWEIDVFEGDNDGLIIAEVELNSENQNIELPLWIGKEVSDDIRYFNLSLVHKPFKSW